MQLLLDAALREKPEALSSWKRYLETKDLQNLSHEETVLLPLIYRNLKEESHPLCKSMYRHTWVSNQRLWAKILPTLEMLLNEGVEKIAILKGMALILAHYQDFGLRVLGDIDILIDQRFVFLAYSLLIRLGWECKLRRFDPKNLEQLSRWHAVNFTHSSGLSLDLHWSFLLESPPSINKKALKEIPLGIHPLPPTHLFFQTCIHGNKKSTAPLIRWIPDAKTLLKSSVDFSLLEDLAKEAHLTFALSGAFSTLRPFVPSLPQINVHPTLLERREFRANQKGQVYLAAYYRARLKGKSLTCYLQHTANLSSPWFIPFYAIYWMLKRFFRFFKISL